jgi:hypothetical protein
MKDYNNYMVNAVIVCVIILLMNACTLFGQKDNNLMEVTVSLSAPQEDLMQYDTVIAYNNLERLTGTNDLVECLSIFNDIKPSIVTKNLSVYIQTYIQTIEFAGYKHTEGEDIVYKTVYFNKYGYIVPYECAVAQLKGNGTDVKILNDNRYHRVYDHDIKD